MTDVIAQEWSAGDGQQPSIAGVLADLGASSFQLDHVDRGFSYRAPGPVDMRMDQSQGPRAEDLIETSTVGQLAELFAAHGERRFAGRIAAAIVRARPINNTAELAETIAGAVPAAVRRRGNPASRVFQALRVAVNQEFDELDAFLENAPKLLALGGRCVVLSYHSGEDGRVKATFASLLSGGCTCPPRLPCVCGAEPEFRAVFTGARKASASEVARNPRSTSARLRAIERLGVAP
jgi:16S rRNA (cytosine1402-N4)-methyltransferase